MLTDDAPRQPQFQPAFIKFLSKYAVFACLVSAISILIADIYVPEHDWIADTISDLGAGRYEFIADIGIYAFSSSLVAIALVSAHVHIGGLRWSLGTVGLALFALVVFLIGARNEYGDNDSEGVVIHVYLVYVTGLLMAVIPILMAHGLAKFASHNRWLLYAISALWVLSAPVFFFMSTDIDGIYERYLALIAFALVFVLARAFAKHATKLSA